MRIVERTGELVCEVVLRPLPPATLSKQYRGHWAPRHRAYQALKADVEWQIRAQCGPARRMPPTLTMDAEWRQCGREPDLDNLVARLSPCMDAAQAMGLVADDALIQFGVIVRVRVARRADEQCVVRFLRHAQDAG